MGKMRAVPRLCEFYPGICLTTEEKARKNLSQGSRRVLVYLLPNTHFTKPTQNTHPNINTHPHITKQFKTTTVQVKTNTLQIYPHEIVII